MRKIKFRAKSKNKKQWIYGYIREIWASKQEDCRYIICPSMSFEKDGWTDSEETEVIPETIGQFTGLTDKNGVEIYEGDICIFENYTYKVIFESGSFCLLSDKDSTIINMYEYNVSEFEVIGNIFNNPELL